MDLEYRVGEQKNPAAVALGRQGGLRGGAARAAALTAEQRTAIAKNAAAVRWKTPKTPPAGDAPPASPRKHRVVPEDPEQ